MKDGDSYNQTSSQSDSIAEPLAASTTASDPTLLGNNSLLNIWDGSEDIILIYIIKLRVVPPVRQSSLENRPSGPHHIAFSVTQILNS